MEVMMVGEGCDDRISDDPKRGGVCNSDVIGQAEEGGGRIGKWGSYRDIMFMVPFAYTFLYPFISTP